jgi:phage shock protein A
MGKITPLFGGKADEPVTKDEPVLSGLIGEMTPHLIAAKNQVADSQKEERRLAKQAEAAARAAGEWEQRAMAAVRAGDDVVARDALLRKRQHDREYEQMREGETEQHQRTAALTRALESLNFRIEEVKHKRDALVARAERADALLALEKEAKDPAKLSVDEMLKRLEAKMTDIETELELSDEAIANLARDAEDALRTQNELTRLKREASDPALLASKPLAKTAPNDAESAQPSASQVLGVSGPQRTKR